jgi:hypothetical protein
MVDAFLLSGLAERLAGEAACDDLNRRTGCGRPPSWDGEDVVVQCSVGPVAGEHVTAPEVAFHESDDAHARALQAELDPADPGEKAKDAELGHRATVRSGSLRNREFGALRDETDERLRSLSGRCPAYSSQDRLEVNSEHCRPG